MNGFWLMQAVVVASKNVNPRSAGGLGVGAREREEKDE